MDHAPPTTPHRKNQQPLTYRVDDATHVTGLSRSFLYKAMADGRLRYSHAGRCRLIQAESLLRLVRSDSQSV